MEVLGQGTYGSVYKYTDSTGNSYAIKVSKEEYDYISGDVLIEIAALKRLQHPNIVEITDILLSIDPNKSSELPSIGIVLPLAQSDISKAVLKNKFTEREMDNMVYQIGGVAYMHSKHILHRDIKPQNILFYSVDSIRISDFGICKPFACNSNSTWTSIAYTLNYRAPRNLA